jgi:PKD repeat protein
MQTLPAASGATSVTFNISDTARTRMNITTGPDTYFYYPLNRHNGTVSTVTCDPVNVTNVTSDSPVDVGTAMNFVATVTGDGPITYTWDFGGTGTQGGTDTNPTFDYDSAGTYTVTLDVVNSCPSTDTFSLPVMVNGGVELSAHSVVTSVGAAAIRPLIITNTGTTTDTFVFTYTSSSPWAVYFSPVDAITVPAGLTGTVDMIVEFPSDATPFVMHTATVTVTPPAGAPVAQLLLSNTGCRFNFVKDAIVDIGDFGVLISFFGSADPYYDIIHDGLVDLGDFGVLINRFGAGCP